MNAVTEKTKKWVRQAREGNSAALSLLLSPETSLLPDAFRDTNVRKYQAALEQLEPRQREAILLQHHLKLSPEEISREMNLPDRDAARLLCDRAWIRLMSLISVRDDMTAQWETD